MRLIDADEARKTATIDLVVHHLDRQPTIDAVPVVHGRWIHDINNLYGCSECMERETMSPKKLKLYCPNCGAKMDSKGGHNAD